MLRTRLKLRPTLVGRAVLLITAELLANAACWVAAGICLSQADGLLGIAMLAWTLGLRHGLDADHISAIDNATRQMVSMGQLPMTCGLYFSLGHSTIVIAVNIAIAISVDVYDRLDGVGAVGGIVGTSVSASFLFLVACINTYFLVEAIRDRRRMKARERLGLPPEEAYASGVQGGGCMVRIIAPVMRAVDRPWKLYPVGILFGFGFDTASSIALLALSAIATRGPDGASIAHGRVVILPFLFTAGMSLVDTLDSILMLYAYAQPDLRSGPQRRIRLFTRADEEAEPLCSVLEAPVLSDEETDPKAHGAKVVEIEGREADVVRESTVPTQSRAVDADDADDAKFIAPADPIPTLDTAPPTTAPDPASAARADRAQRVLAGKTATMSSLSISLTLLSILVALSISLIEIMGLIGENCGPCTAAAEAEDGGGLAGSWWRAWARANDASGYVGAAIVGCFVAILVVYHLARWGLRRRHRRRRQRSGGKRPAQPTQAVYGV